MPPLDRRALNEKRQGVEKQMATAMKHYIRKYVWLRIARQRHRRIARPIRYFTLTTKDLFDVKLFENEGLLEHTARGYPGLGFCEFIDKEFDDILRRIRWCGWSHKGSFEEMVNENPRFEHDFLFDIVNLDFILVPFPEQESPLDGTWGAIQKLLQVQGVQQQSFDLLITFRGTREGTNEDALAKLTGLMDKNLSVGRGVAELDQRVGHHDPHRLLDEDYVEFLCVSLPKLVIGEALALGFELSRADTYKYPRKRPSTGETYFIVTFAFSLEIPATSQRGFADAPVLVQNYDAAVPAIFAQQAEDIGALLNSDPALTQDLDAEVTALLG